MSDMILCHHGIKGQKWGVRRYQYEDGTLTPEGKIHYGRKEKKQLDIAEGRRSLQKETLAKRAQVTATTGIKGASAMTIASVISGKTSLDVLLLNAGIGGAAGVIAGFTGMTVSYFLNRALANKHEKKAQKLIDKYGDVRLEDFKAKEIREETKLQEKAKKRASIS